MASAVKRQVETRLKKVKPDFIRKKEHVRELGLELDDASDEVDHLQWKLTERRE